VAHRALGNRIHARAGRGRIATAIPEFAANPDQAVNAAVNFGFPVVLKVQSPEVTHKSGSVASRSISATKPRFETPSNRIRRGLADRMPGATFEGAAIAPQARPEWN